MLEDMVGAVLRDAAAAPDATEQWSKFAELGLLAMPFSAAEGGLVSSDADLMLVMGALGKGASGVPFMASTIMGSRLLRELADDAQRAALVPALIAGQAVVVLAHGEPLSRYAVAHVTTTATPCPGGYRLSGSKCTIISGGRATHFLVSARLSEGISLFLVPASSAGMAVRPCTGALVDGADIRLDEVFVPTADLLGLAGGALPAIETALDHGMVALVADAVGAMDELLGLTVEYLKTRKQFGVPIASFQALQHRAVDMMVEVEQARSMASYAAAMLGEDPPMRRLAAAAAKAHVNKAARFVGESAVQLHGAVGMTLESPAGQLFRRLAVFQLLLADRDHCLRLLAQNPTSMLEDWT